MKTFASTALISALMVIASGGAAAQDAMKKDGAMAKDGMMKDGMTMQQCKDHMAMAKKDGMTKDAAMMKKDSMCTEMMNKDKDGMRKDGVPAAGTKK